MTVKSLLVLIGVDVAELEAGLGKVRAKLEAHEAQFRKIGLTMTAIGGTMTAFFGKCVSEAVKAEAAEMKLRQALSNVEGASKGGADMLLKYAEALMQTTGIEHEEINNAQAMLATFGLNERQIAALIPRVLDMAVAHRNAVGGTVDLTGAAQSLGRAVTGHVELLGRHGVILSEQTKKTGDFNLVLKDLDKAFGGAAAAAGQTFAGQMRILKINIGEVMESIGFALLPIILRFVIKAKEIAQSIGEWIEKHKSLVGTLVPIIAGFGAINLVLGPILMTLPKLIAGINAFSKSLILFATNPIPLAIAAIGLLILSIYKLREAEKDEAATLKQYGIDMRQQSVDVMALAAKQVGLTAGAYKGLLEKYHGDAQALQMSVRFGKEELISKKNLADATEKYKKELEKHKKGVEGEADAYGKAKKALEDFLKNLGNLGTVQTEVDEKIKTLKATLTDELKKATLSEVEYEKWAAGEKLKERQKEIKLEVVDAGTRKELLLLAEQDYEAALKAIHDKEFADKLNFIKSIADKEDETIVLRKQGQIEYLGFMAGINNDILRVTDRQYKTDQALLRQDLLEKQAMVNKWKADGLISEQQRFAALLALQKSYGLASTKMAMDSFKEQFQKVVAIVSGIMSQIGAIFNQSYTNEMIRIDNEYNKQKKLLDTKVAGWDTEKTALAKASEEKQRIIDKDYETDKRLREAKYTAEKRAIDDSSLSQEEKTVKLRALSDAYDAESLEKSDAHDEAVLKNKDETDTAITLIEDTKQKAIQKLEEDTTKIKNKAQREQAKNAKATAVMEAIVGTAVAVVNVLKLGIPGIVLAVVIGALGAIQIAKIKSTPLPALGKGGYFDRPTAAIVGDVPEWVIPDSKMRLALAGAGSPINFKQYVYFSGDIRTDWDIDEISEKLARKTQEAIQRGRR